MPVNAEVTVIIPNYNGKKLLKKCIETLEQQSCRTFTTLIVDNGSTDGSTELTSAYLELNWIKLKENTGFCKAVNLGIENTNTPYFLLLNNDTEVWPQFVENLLNAIKKSERIFSCGAQMLDYHRHNILDNAGDYYTAFGWALARGKGKASAAFEKEKYVFSCCGGASIYRTDVAKELGAFDENHFAYLEDVDIGYRAKINGYKNRYIPSAKVIHVGSATTGSRYNEKKVFLSARNNMFLLYKNMPLLQLIFNLPLIFAGILVKTLFFVKKGLAGEYLRGIKTGIKERKNCTKVLFQPKNLGNYIVIQWELWWNIVRILFSR